ncbi:MAG: hypothetical protein KJ824_14385 [Alphaproteobacteria bacterium]|nr:hypothetical protein [Alphaproteobacteria bacterium]
MANQRSQRVEDGAPRSTRVETEPERPQEFPVREYIGAMALELAQMARWDGDEALGRLLDSAAGLAGEPLSRGLIEIVEPLTPRRPS